MSSKRAPSPEILRSHEAAFIEHYEWLLRWALQFTNRDRERAEDLVQEVFAQFASAHTDLSAVQNIPAYLYTTLRNTHVSEVRLACRSHTQIQSDSILEFSLAETALGAADPYTIFQTQDQLRSVCRYACLRKQSSRAGSVLILRFFHGYHLSETAEVLGSTCQAVRQCLKSARNEVRLFLSDPGCLKFIDRTHGLSARSSTVACAADELLAQLRREIFDSREGECLTSESIESLYIKGLIATADNLTLAHIVSCPACLDAVNTRLGLPLLAERHPADALGPNNNWRGGPNGPRAGGGAGDTSESRRRIKDGESKISDSFLLRCRRRAQEIFEHHPRELCVSVNGHVLGSQTVNSQTSRLRLDVTINEEPGFVEVLSEERVRLLVMMIQPPPDGAPVQERRVALSEGRHIGVTFHHGHPWPMVEVVYEEPNFVADELQLSTSNSEPRLLAFPPGEPEETALLKVAAPRQRARAGILEFFRNLHLLQRGIWLRPNFISAVVSLILIGALLFFRLSVTPTVTAASLLERASASEFTSAQGDFAVHRVIDLEQRRDAGGEIVSRNRIEVWRDGAKGLTVRRLYDDRGKLIAGVWAADNFESPGRSIRRIYRRDQPQTIESGARDPQQVLRSLELWQLEPSARDYLAIIGNPTAARVSENGGDYVISYATAHVDGLVQATLTLRKSDLHAVGQKLVVRDGTETYSYRFVEASFERPLLRSVSPAAFEPDAELLPKAHAENTTSKREGALASSPVTTAPAVATAELEIDLAYALDQFRTRFGDQISLTKTIGGLLEIKGVVDTEETRREILQALAGLTAHPAVRVEISTAAEVLARQQRSESVVVREFAGSDQSIPLYAELSRHFASRGGAGQTNEQVDRQVRDFAARVVSHSRRAVSHSLELKQLSARFSTTELNELTPSARAKWLALVRNHAEALRRELSDLDGELQRTIFRNESRVSEVETIAISNDASLLLAIDRLHKLVLATDEAVRSGFTASSGASTGEMVRGLRFRTGLATSEKLAGEIQAAAASK